MTEAEIFTAHNPEPDRPLGSMARVLEVIQSMRARGSLERCIAQALHLDAATARSIGINMPIIDLRATWARG